MFSLFERWVGKWDTEVQLKYDLLAASKPNRPHQVVACPPRCRRPIDRQLHIQHANVLTRRCSTALISCDGICIDGPLNILNLNILNEELRAVAISRYAAERRTLSDREWRATKGRDREVLKGNAFSVFEFEVRSGLT